MSYTDLNEQDFTVNCIPPTSPGARVLNLQPLSKLLASSVVQSMGIPYL